MLLVKVFKLNGGCLGDLLTVLLVSQSSRPVSHRCSLQSSARAGDRKGLGKPPPPPYFLKNK